MKGEFLNKEAKDFGGSFTILQASSVPPNDGVIVSAHRFRIEVPNILNETLLLMEASILLLILSHFEV